MVAFVTHVIEPARAPPHSGPEMSPAASTTQGMQQNPPPSLAGPDSEIPARPAVVPMLPTRLPQPGRQAPLPDPVAVRRLAVPDPAPPFDDEPAYQQRPSYRERGDERYRSRRIGPAAPPGPSGHSRTRLMSHPPAAGLADRPAARPGPARRTAGRASCAGPGRDVAGSRPGHATDALDDRAGTQAHPPARPDAGHKPAAQAPPGHDLGAGCDVVEMTAVVGFGPKIRVLAVRLEREQAGPRRAAGRRWCCTAIESADNSRQRDQQRSRPVLARATVTARIHSCSGSRPENSNHARGRLLAPDLQAIRRSARIGCEDRRGTA